VPLVAALPEHASCASLSNSAPWAGLSILHNGAGGVGGPPPGGWGGPLATDAVVRCKVTARHKVISPV
jgi:hypothetical protein